MFPVVKAGDEIPSLPAFIVGKNGIYLRKETRLGVSTTKVSTVNHLDDVPLELEWALPTIPAGIVGKIVGFLLRCDKERGGEGAMLLCLNDKDEWDLIVPRQDNGGADVKYYIDPDTVPQGWTLIGTVHSHPWGGMPSPSITDENDDKKLDGLHIIAGNLGPAPKFNVAAVIDGIRFKWANAEDVLEMSGPLDVPDEWLDQVKKKSWAKQSFGSGGSWGGGSSSYTHKVYVRPGESPAQALWRERKFSFGLIEDDAVALGLKIAYTITDEDGNVLDNDAFNGVRATPEVASQSSYPTSAPIVPMNGTDGQATAFPDDDKPVVWEGIDPDECEDKHPGKMCPNNCGCHCEPCKNKTVGAFDASKSQTYSGESGWDLKCECKTCYKGCDGKVPDDDYKMNAPYGSLICDDCKRGAHFEDKAAVINSRLGGTM